MTGVDGEEILSAQFPVNRGVVQGDITSPIYFILVLEFILRAHDVFIKCNVTIYYLIVPYLVISRGASPILKLYMIIIYH